MLKLRSAFVLAGFAAAFPLSVFAQSVKVENTWARSTVAGQTAGGVFMTIVSEKKTALVGADSPAAGRVEIHEMKSEGGVMKMRPISRLELPAGKKVMLQPGGHHLMLIGIRQPLQAGEKLPITLKLDDGSGKPLAIAVSAEVRAAANGQAHDHHMHH